MSADQAPPATPDKKPVKLTSKGNRWGRPPQADYEAAGSRKEALKQVITRLPSELHNYMRVIGTTKRFDYRALVRLHQVAIEQFLDDRPFEVIAGPDEPKFAWLTSGAPKTARDGDTLVQVNCFLPAVPGPGEQKSVRKQVEDFKEAHGISMASLLFTAFDWYMRKYHGYTQYLEFRAREAAPVLPGAQKLITNEGGHG